MAPAYLTGKKAEIDEFLARFDVWQTLLRSCGYPNMVTDFIIGLPL